MKRSLLVLCFLAIGSAVMAADPKPTPASKDDSKFRWSDLLPRSLQKNPRISISVHTNFTEEGKKRPAASKDNPVYYQLLDGGLTEEGDAVGGERPPKPQKLADVLKNSLTTSGFLPATEGHPATLLVYYRWGSFNHMAPIDGDPGNDVLDTSDPMQMKNLMLRASLVGGARFAQDMMRALSTHSLEFFQMRGANNDELVSMSMGDLYFVLAVAFDMEAAKQSKRVPLWTTQISTDSNGLIMDDTLQALVTSSRDYFGHDTKGPVLFYPRLYPGHVEIGEATVVGTGQPTPPKGTGTDKNAGKKR